MTWKMLKKTTWNLGKIWNKITITEIPWKKKEDNSLILVSSERSSKQGRKKQPRLKLNSRSFKFIWTPRLNMICIIRLHVEVDYIIHSCACFHPIMIHIITIYFIRVEIYMPMTTQIPEMKFYTHKNTNVVKCNAT